MQTTPFWKTPQGMILIAGAGVILLGTLYLFASTMRAPAPTAAAATTPTVNLVDENALIAANAERPGETGNAAAPPAATQAAADKPENVNPDEVAAEAQRALDGAQDQVEGDKPPEDENDPGK